MNIQGTDLLEVVRRKPKKDVDMDLSSNADGHFDENPPSSSPDVVLRKNNFNSSTKLNALIMNLRRSVFGFQSNHSLSGLA